MTLSPSVLPLRMLAALVLSVFALVATSASAQQPGLEDFLRAGEFGPARAAAQGLPAGAERDRWLARIAAEQGRVGARRAGLGTAGLIGGGAMRGQAFNNLAGQPLGAAGGAALADFDTLIELIQSTILPDSWLEAGGDGDISPYPTGVYVDAHGVLRQTNLSDGEGLAERRMQAAAPHRFRQARETSPLRKVSLTRLEREVQRRWAEGLPPDEEMLNFAGLQRVQYVFVYPETQEIVLAGPAGDWRCDEQGRWVSLEHGRPVVRLDDVVVMLRLARSNGDGVFGCAITPRQENLAEARRLMDESAQTPIKASQKQQWLEQLRTALGRQDIEVFGLDPRTRAAHVLVEADYHMKRVGMGLEPSVVGLASYLDEAADAPDAAASSVVRWWFTLNYDAVQATADRLGFAIQGQGVRVMSENEFLTKQGKRVHTGESDRLTQGFADGFTRHFEALAEKYPVYADLRNIFDLALVAQLLKAHDAFGQVDWSMVHFGDPQRYRVALSEPAREVDSIAGLKQTKKREIVAAVSGGVRADARKLADAEAVEVEPHGRLATEQDGATPAELTPTAWWWD